MLFLYMCEPNLTNIGHIEIKFEQTHKRFSPHVGIIHT